MVRTARRRWLVGAVLALGVVAVGAVVAFRVAVSVLEQRVAQAIGPRSEIAALRVGWTGVVIEGLRVPGPPGWPAKDALRAERVAVVPSLSSLVSGETYSVAAITIARPYLSALRSRGKLVALPGLHGDERAQEATLGASPSVRLRRIALEDGVVEIFDATVATPPLKIRLEQIEASVRDVAVPGLRGRSRFAIDGVVVGKTRNGHAHLAGWVEIGTRDSSITTRLRSVDLVPFEPYLMREGDTGIRSGRFDLDLHSKVTDGHLHAPGTITLSGLEVASNGGVKGTFMGVSQRALLAGLEEKGGTLSADFVIEGDIDNPAFSLNEALGARLAYALADTLGVNLGGLAEGVGTLGQKGAEAAGEAARGLGGAFRNLLEPGTKR